MMKAMILAAGRGEHLRPETDTIPKPLLKVGEYTLIEHQLRRLALAGFVDVVINVSYRAKQIIEALGNGEKYGLDIQYSYEAQGRLETGGGIFQALPLLGNAPFLVVSCDIWTDFPLQILPTEITNVAHLVVVDNPAHHLEGDFCLESGKVTRNQGERYTYGNIGVLHPSLFEDCPAGAFPLSKLFFEAIDKGLVTGQHYFGEWINVGSHEALAEVTALAKGV